MTVYVKKTDFPIEANINPYTAALGFYLRGEQVVWYHDQAEIPRLTADDVVVDYVMETQIFLEKMGIIAPHFDYPESLQPFMGRNIHQGTIGQIVNHPENWGVFIKPVDTEKSFTGRVVKSAHDLIGIGAQNQFPIWISDAVEFLAEWRAFIVQKQVVDVRPYQGDYHIHFDGKVLDAAVKAWQSSPIAYSLDIGVTKSGKTLVIEVNDGYSLGCYGLNPYSYAIFLEKRWHEITAPYFAVNDSFVLG
ncbi:ATP-grasp domain-containing protein [Lacticaseibacillus hulanensis]|uniref:ATP-grasp domain-containing protein n=1 Tax=Lacticaseibacillus hulanensis TaxID=2493111 RepID=UPI000FDC247D|nr:ATP-grasp domain-containing protein [Lacticaseibacillus hulanensis]